jgi:hypothetical protein
VCVCVCVCRVLVLGVCAPVGCVPVSGVWCVCTCVHVPVSGLCVPVSGVSVGCVCLTVCARVGYVCSVLGARRVCLTSIQYPGERPFNGRVRELLLFSE